MYIFLLQINLFEKIYYIDIGNFVMILRLNYYPFEYIFKETYHISSVTIAKLLFGCNQK